MKRKMNRGPIVLAAAVGLLLPSGAAAQSAARASRVDFDDQLVQGQVNKGAAHLIERRDANLGSLVRVREGYRKEILDEKLAETPTDSSSVAELVLPVAKKEVRPKKAKKQRARNAGGPRARSKR